MTTASRSTPWSTIQRTYVTCVLESVGGAAGNDQVVFVHPNSLCVVCLAESHELRRLSPTGIDVRVTLSSEADDAMAADAPSGKRKRGGSIVKPSTPLATAAVGDKSFPLQFCVQGKVMEMNDRLAAEPHLLCTEPIGGGFLAIVMAREDEIASLRRSATRVEPRVGGPAPGTSGAEEAAARGGDTEDDGGGRGGGGGKRQGRFRPEKDGKGRRGGGGGGRGGAAGGGGQRGGHGGGPGGTAGDRGGGGGAPEGGGGAAGGGDS